MYFDGATAKLIKMADLLFWGVAIYSVKNNTLILNQDSPGIAVTEGL